MSLTQEEEVAYILDWQRMAQHKKEQLGSHLFQRCTCGQEETAVFADILARGEAAEEALWEDNKGWIRQLAARYQWSGTPLDDLLYRGYEALFKAVAKFDVPRRTRLRSYARPIVQSVLRRIAAQDAGQSWAARKIAYRLSLIVNNLPRPWPRTDEIVDRLANDPVVHRWVTNPKLKNKMSLKRLRAAVVELLSRLHGDEMPLVDEDGDEDHAPTHASGAAAERPVEDEFLSRPDYGQLYCDAYFAIGKVNARRFVVLRVLRRPREELHWEKIVAELQSVVGDLAVTWPSLHTACDLPNDISANWNDVCRYFDGVKPVATGLRKRYSRWDAQFRAS